MKVLIADDEKNVRKAIRLLADWNKYGIETIIEAEDGASAIQLVEQMQPDIVITDIMMPVRNGLDLLQWLQAGAFACKTIMITGYRDLELARDSIKYGAVYYMVKPIVAAELDEALSLAVAAFRDEEQARLRDIQQSIQYNALKPIAMDKMLTDFVWSASSTKDSAGGICAQFRIEPDNRYWRACLIDLQSLTRPVLEKYRNNVDLLAFTLINISNDFLHRERRGTAFRDMRHPDRIVLLLWHPGEDVQLLLRQINETGLLPTLGTRCDIGIGSAVHDYLELQASYMAALRSLQQRNILKREGWLHEGHDGQSPQSIDLQPFKQQLSMAILSKNNIQINSALTALRLALLEKGHVSQEQFLACNRELLILLKHWLAEVYPNIELDAFVSRGFSPSLPRNDNGVLLLQEWQDDMEHSILQVMKELDQEYERSFNLIYDMARYLELNCQEDLTLQDLSERYFLSKGYISRKFKAVFQQNIPDYLTRARIDRAKVLLLNPDLKIAQVAAMSGYADEKYFYKVFKKMTGASPNQYRKISLLP